MIPVFRPCYGKEEIEAVAEILKSGWVGLGPKTEQFEREFAEYIKVDHAVALNSCTAALHLAFALCDVRGKEVITTPITFVSMNEAILYNGGEPVFCDVERDTLCIDAAKIEPLITERTAAVVVVHYGGIACDMDAIADICRRHGLRLVEDCAHAAGSTYKDSKLGTFGDFGCFSFHAVKNLAVGDGGMIITNDAAADIRLRQLRWLGIDKDTWSRVEIDKSEYRWSYTVNEIGWKYHLNDLASGIGLVQLRKLERMNARRRAICQAYVDAFQCVPPIETPRYRTGVEDSACHNFVIRTPLRNALSAKLMERGIATSVHYYPNNRYPLFESFRGETPVAFEVADQILTLPVFPDLSREEQDFVVSSVLEIVESMARSSTVSSAPKAGTEHG